MTSPPPTIGVFHGASRVDDYEVVFGLDYNGNYKRTESNDALRVRCNL